MVDVPVVLVPGLEEGDHAVEEEEEEEEENESLFSTHLGWFQYYHSLKEKKKFINNHCNALRKSRIYIKVRLMVHYHEKFSGLYICAL